MSVTLNGRSWSISDFQNYQHARPKSPDAAGTPAFPDGIFGDMLAELEAGAAYARTQAFAYAWIYDTSTSMADPGTGEVRFNNADPMQATQIAISRETDDGAVISGILASWDDGGSTSNRGTLKMVQADDPTRYAVFTVTGSVTNNTTWFQVAVTVTQNTSTLQSGALVVLDFTPTASMAMGSSVTAGTGAALGLDDSVTGEGTTPLPLHFDVDTDTGLVRTAANAMSLVTGGFGAVRCSSTEVSLRPDLNTFAAGNASRPAHLGVNNNTTGNNVIVYAISTGTDAGVDNVTKNGGPHNFWTGATSGFSGAVRQFSVPHTASADRYGTVTGGVSGSGTCVTMSTSAGDLNFDPASTSTVRITGLPLAAAGLASGALWNNSGVLNVA